MNFEFVLCYFVSLGCACCWKYAGGPYITVGRRSCLTGCCCVLHPASIAINAPNIRLIIFLIFLYRNSCFVLNLLILRELGEARKVVSNKIATKVWKMRGKTAQITHAPLVTSAMSKFTSERWHYDCLLSLIISHVHSRTRMGRAG